MICLPDVEPAERHRLPGHAIREQELEVWHDLHAVHLIALDGQVPERDIELADVDRPDLHVLVAAVLVRNGEAAF